MCNIDDLMGFNGFLEIFIEVLEIFIEEFFWFCDRIHIGKNLSLISRICLWNLTSGRLLLYKLYSP